MAELPLVARAANQPYSASEIEAAAARLRRRLQQLAVSKRTVKRLESLWQLYNEIRRSCAWRMSAVEVEQFLRVILRVGRGVVWGERASELVRAHRHVLNPAVAMWLLRILARSGDVQRFDEACGMCDRALGPGWAADDEEYLANRAILYAKADLPAHAARVLEEFPGDIAPQSAAERLSTRVLAMSELLLAWTRAQNAEKAWETISRLLVLGYGRKTREWNGLLHMHAVDLRYRFDLLDEVLSRMQQAGVAYDMATYNIMMHASLLRGDQRRWREWLARMEQAGIQPNGYTCVAVARQLAVGGRWAEARAALEKMPAECGEGDEEPRGARAAVLTSIGELTNQIPGIMQRFREAVLAGGDVIPAVQFAAVCAAALACPAVWAAEIALLARCLEAGRVEQSAVVDAVAQRLPGLDRARVRGRPLLQSELGDVARAFMDDLRDPARLGAEGLRFVPGAERRSYAQAVGAVIRGLLRGGMEQRAVELLRASEGAGVAAGSPATLLALLQHCTEQPRDLASRIASTTFALPTAAAASALLRRLDAGDLGAAQEEFARLERLVEQYPSVRAFNALLAFARDSGDPALLERKWRQMAAAGVLPNAMSHVTRITCYSQQDDQLRTRRAYTDMLEHGYPPTYAAVNALVRCCVRTGAVALALTVMRHAEGEHAVSLNVTTYNYVLSRLSSLPRMHVRMRRMFDAMRGTAEERLVRPLADVDVVRRVRAEREGIEEMHVVSALRTGVGGRILAEEDRSKDAVRDALVEWMTSREACSAEPTLLETESSLSAAGSGQTAHPPAPNATTFIILVRMHGKRREWTEVLRTWDALLAFNRRMELVGRRHAFARTLAVVPFGRLVAWVILALYQVGRWQEAQELWDRALKEGYLGQTAVDKGMKAMMEHLMTKTDAEE
ncbi:hypothetical protein GGI15_004416 [Coemansia interrupta]|uniref:Pentatricopeptide repeat-containing protein n=1 Tax=Coemansia interrupta TaxID=1126814 RepID=A0A9W8H7C9_9FUNG|nr:hypothetical protein GGI15_004416 [Coemansia interrupta]